MTPFFWEKDITTTTEEGNEVQVMMMMIAAPQVMGVVFLKMMMHPVVSIRLDTTWDQSLPVG